MNIPQWTIELPASIMVIDSEGIVLEMNDRAAQVTYAAEGGRNLLGKSVLGCHPAAARAKLEELLQSHEPYIYTTEKAGVKKFIQHLPWFEAGEYRGIVEVVTVLPPDVPHFIRG
jgi:transcriptional regulator with PAS, ATPase and Fis domain